MSFTEFIFHSMLPYNQQTFFEIQANFETSPPNDLKMTLTIRVAGWLEVRSPNHANGPQNDLEHYSIRVPHICGTSVFESQCSLRFALLPTLFALQAILRQVYRIPNDLEHFNFTKHFNLG